MVKQLTNKFAPSNRHTIDYLGAVQTLIKIYDRVRPNGNEGTGSVEDDVFEIVSKWIKENE